VKAHKRPKAARWNKRVEGQIKEVMRTHPEYFTTDKTVRWKLVKSLRKRIVGEIVVAVESDDDASRAGVLADP
jgi:hypothetical protein